MKNINFWKTGGGILGLVLFFVILIALNIIANQIKTRLDCTEEKLYTLSEGTRQILKKIDRPVTLKLFFSSSEPQMPVFIKAYAKMVRQILDEYRILSNGKIRIEEYDPKPDSEAEDWAGRYGVAGQQIGGMFGPKVYFGLVAVVGDTEATLPAINPNEHERLEYNISRMIVRLINPQKPVVGVMSKLPVLGAEVPPYMLQPGMRPPQAWVAFKELKEDYIVREVSPTVSEIDKEINALVVVHPKELSDETLYAIDQFVLRGGSLIVFVDPLCLVDRETSGSQSFMPMKTSSDLNKLFSAWGVGYTPDKVVADMRAASRVQMEPGKIEENSAWLSLDRRSINAKDVLTAKLESIMLPFAGVFRDETSADITMSPLIRSSASAGMVDAMTAIFGGVSINREFKKEGKELYLAVRLSGKFKTAFPEGKPKKSEDDKSKSDAEKKDDEKKDDEKKEESLKEGVNKAVILVADVDLLYDRFCVQEIDFFGFKANRPFNDNLNFFINALEQVATGPELSDVRARGKYERPFDRVLELAEKAREKWYAMEQELVNKLQQTQSQLQELERQKDKNQRFVLSKEQKEAIARFKQEELRIKDELKIVRRNLRRDIEQLGVKVKIINIALMPLLVAVAGVSFGIYRRKKH